MTSDELREIYVEAVKIAQAERRTRMFVFREKPELMKIKVAEMNRLLVLLEQMKEVAKQALYERPVLLDVPRKVEYK